MRPLSFLLLPNLLPVPPAQTAQPGPQRLRPPPVPARSQQSSSLLLPAVPPQREPSPQPRFLEQAPLPAAHPSELLSLPQLAASPPPVPPEGEMQSQVSAAALPQCSEPGAATEQSVSAQASPQSPPVHSQPVCSQQARSLVVSSFPAHPARARSPQACSQAHSGPHSPEASPQSARPPEPRSPPVVEAALPREPPLVAAQPDAIPAASFQGSLWPHRQDCEPSTSRSSASLRLHAAPTRRRSPRAPSKYGCAHARPHRSRSSSNASSSRLRQPL